jgi:hypothetical protein
MPEMADPHPYLRTLSRIPVLGGREEIGTNDREGINPPEYFARGYYVNEGWLVWALGVLLFIRSVNKAGLRY